MLLGYDLLKTHSNTLELPVAIHICCWVWYY